LGTTTTFTLSGITAASGCPVGITDPNTTFSVSNPSLTLQTDTNGPNGEAISCAGLNDGNIRTTTTGAIAPITYLWDDGTATDSRSNLPAGTYSLTITDAAGCTATGSTTLIAPAPIQVLATGQAAGCVGTNTGALTISNISGGVGPFEYSFDNQFFGAVGDLPAVLPDLASGSYTLYIQDANDCPASLSVVVPEGRTLILNLGQDRTIQAGDSIMLVPMTDFTPVSWTWTPREGLRQPDSLSTYAAPLATTVYRLQATDAQGCSISDIVRIIVEQNVQVYIPSAFSPDGNGTNDQLMIFAGTGVERVEVFQIFDRWGNQVFAKEAFAPNDPQYGWDGRLNGRDMNPAVFVYFAQVLLSTGEVTTLRGEVVLVR
jgi:gliding motility-associated-like protein